MKQLALTVIQTRKVRMGTTRANFISLVRLRCALKIRCATMTDVSEDQFEFESDVLIGDVLVHLPTGARFATSGWVQWTDAGNVLTDGRCFDRQELWRVAVRILGRRSWLPKSRSSSQIHV